MARLTSPLAGPSDDDWPEPLAARCEDSLLVTAVLALVDEDGVDDVGLAALVDVESSERGVAVPVVPLFELLEDAGSCPWLFVPALVCAVSDDAAQIEIALSTAMM